jgi:putative ABC transport system ATP-binding protein
MSLIQINKVTKIYDGTAVPVKALNEVDLKIEAGEFTAIVGPSGSGKTTLLNIVGGLDVPTSGNVIIDNVDISTYKPDELVNFRLHHIGFVFQA